MKRGKLLDTNHLGDALMPGSGVRDRITLEARLGWSFGVCIPVLCELEVGFRGLTRPETPRVMLREVRKRVRLWPLEGDFPEHFAGVAVELRRRGRVLSTVDMMLAALCRQMNLTLLTTDRDFEALPDIRVENWVR